MFKYITTCHLPPSRARLLKQPDILLLAVSGAAAAQTADKRTGFGLRRGKGSAVRPSSFFSQYPLIPKK